MNSQVLQIAVPLILLGLLAAFFARLAWQALHADRQRQLKARRLTGTARNAVLGSVGWDHGDNLAQDFDCGMVSREVQGHVVVARQGRLTQDTIGAI